MTARHFGGGGDAHRGDNPVLAQECEQRQQRQAKHRKIVALDALEQLRAEAFELVSADRTQHVTRRRASDNRPRNASRKSAHREPRHVDVPPDDRAFACDNGRGDQFMRLPRRRSKMLARLCAHPSACPAPRPSIASIWSAPITKSVPFARDTRAPSAPPAHQPDRAASGLRRGSSPWPPLHRRAAHRPSNVRPAASSMCRRAALPEARISLTRCAMLRQQVEHRGGGLFDRAARHIDRRPPFPLEQFLRVHHFTAHRIFIGVAAGAGLFHRRKTIAADVNQAVGGDQSDQRQAGASLQTIPAATARQAPSARWRPSHRGARDKHWSAFSRCG